MSAARFCYQWIATRRARPPNDALMSEAWGYRIELWKVKDCASDPDADPAWAIRHCRAGQARLVATIEGLTDEQGRCRPPSHLPDWTIAHVLTTCGP